MAPKRWYGLCMELELSSRHVQRYIVVRRNVPAALGIQ